LGLKKFGRFKKVWVGKKNSGSKKKIGRGKKSCKITANNNPLTPFAAHASIFLVISYPREVYIPFKDEATFKLFTFLDIRFRCLPFLPKVDRALLGSHTSYEYAHNKEGIQKVNIHFSEPVEKSNPRGEAELNCERSELDKGLDVALANPKCDSRTHGPKISLFLGATSSRKMRPHVAIRY
jgi:hypothetical protein